MAEGTQRGLLHRLETVDDVLRLDIGERPAAKFQLDPVDDRTVTRADECIRIAPQRIAVADTKPNLPHSVRSEVW